MTKLSLWIKGYISCFGWIVAALWDFVLEHCTEIRFWKKHDNFDDHIWYAERVNGRLAMIALTITLILELVSHNSIWDLFYGH